MTYSQFYSAIRKFRPEITCIGKHQKGKVMISFNHSKAYEYCGSYQEILDKLNIPAIDNKYIEELKEQLKVEEERATNPDTRFANCFRKVKVDTATIAAEHLKKCEKLKEEINYLETNFYVIK